MAKLPTKKVPRIPLEAWEKIVEESNSANMILNHPEFKFLLKYLQTAKDSSISLIAHNSVKDVLETTTTKDGYSKTLKSSKEEQLNEIAGQIKFIEKLLTDLNTFSGLKAEYEKRAKNKELIIEIDKEDA